MFRQVWIAPYMKPNDDSVFPARFFFFSRVRASRRSRIQTWSWWRHQMEPISALLALCVGNSPVTGEFPSQRPVTRSLDVFFDLRLNKRLSKQSRGWWFKASSCSLSRHCNMIILCNGIESINFSWLAQPCARFHGKHHYLLHITFWSAQASKQISCDDICQVSSRFFFVYFHKMSLNSIPACINNYIRYKVRGGIAYPSENFTGQLLKFGNGFNPPLNWACDYSSRLDHQATSSMSPWASLVASNIN